MDSVSKSVAIQVWDKLADFVEAQYKNRVNVMFDYANVNSCTRCFTSSFHTRKVDVFFGLASIRDRDSLRKDEFIWLTHQLVHEFGHVNQRMKTFDDANVDSVLMAKQQIICNVFPVYNSMSYYNQLVEIDAERYSWSKTVELLTGTYPDVFAADDVKQSLVNGLHTYQGTWYADKHFDTWDEGLERLNETFESAKTKTWGIHSNIDYGIEQTVLSDKFMKNRRLMNAYSMTFGMDRNDLLFRYCVDNDAVNVKKFPCLKRDVKLVKRELRKLPDVDDVQSDSFDNNGLSL